MTYCIDFFRKFKKDGNFCGLDKSQVSRLTAYLEIVELLMKQKIPEEQIYENFSVRAATPLIAAKGDAHTEGLNYVTAQLKEGKKVQTGDMQTTLNSCTCATTPPEPRPKESCSTTTSKPVLTSKTEEKPKLGKIEKPPMGQEQPSIPVKKQDPSKCYSYQPGSAPKTPEVSSAQILGDQIRKQELAEAEKNQPAPVEEPEPVIVPPPRPPTPAPALPPLSPDADIIERLKRDEILLENAGFTRASEMIGDLESAKIIKPAPYKIMAVPITAKQAGDWLTAIVRGYLSPKSQEVWEDIRKTGELGDTDLEIFQGLLDQAGDRVPG